MRYTNSFINTRKDVGKGVEATGHILSEKAGLVYQVGSGLYDFLPLGNRVVSNIERVIREEMNRSGALEISMPVIQPSDLWIESGRWDVYGAEMFRLKNREGKEFLLGPTHEELVCQLVRSSLKSYKQLPFTLYQIGRKFRDEARPRHGLLRTKEFMMKDGYSFDVDNNGLDESYKKMRDAYLKIFGRMELEVIPIKANPGEIGGSGSEEFLAPSDFGEDRFIIDGTGAAIKIDGLNHAPVTGVRGGIEVGHIFKLGDKYSRPMNVRYSDVDGQERYATMGCYGIGISRLVNAIVEQHCDADGIIWPREISPLDVILLPIGNDENVKRVAEDIYEKFRQNNVAVLLDDRDSSAGVKFKDADLIGAPLKLIVGSRGLERGVVEYKDRKTKKVVESRPDSVVDLYFNLIKD